MRYILSRFSYKYSLICKEKDGVLVLTDGSTLLLEVGTPMLHLSDLLVIKRENARRESRLFLTAQVRHNHPAFNNFEIDIAKNAPRRIRDIARNPNSRYAIAAADLKAGDMVVIFSNWPIELKDQ